MVHSRKVHTFRDTGQIDFSGRRTQAEQLVRVVIYPPPDICSSNLADKKKACISESMHFSTMNHRRKKSLLHAFHPYSMSKSPKSEKKIVEIFFLKIFLSHEIYIFFCSKSSRTLSEDSEQKKKMSDFRGFNVEYG